MKRVVTGHSAEGKSVFIEDGQPARVVKLENLPGMEMTELWSTDEVPILPTNHQDPTIPMSSFVPGRKGSRFRIVRFPSMPELTKALEDGLDLEAFKKEYLEKVPGLAECHEGEDPAMHTTDTIDYNIILSGEIWLELDDGNKVYLKPGDCVIQNGTRHAWRNEGNEPCFVASVMIGAEQR
jgi:mannose-6-phosphate isomerase-like protein (cupin superfamily)